MVENRDPKTARRVRLAVIVAATVAFLWFFPPFHVLPLTTQTTATPAGVVNGAFDAHAAAARIWTNDLPTAAPRAIDVREVTDALRKSPADAKLKYAKAAGLGTSYFFVRGSGKVVASDRNYLRVALDGAATTLVAIRTGPVFGNTVRDGCGILEVNTFPGLQEFNDLSAELNAMVEKNVQPALREKATIGTNLQFVGCAEAPEANGEVNEPMLMIVPVKADLR